MFFQNNLYDTVSQGDNMEYFVKLKLIRIENELTQEQVATALGITRSAYCGYEIGRRKMSLEMLETLAKFYRIPISTFFNTDGQTVNDSEHYGEQPMYLSSLSKEERDLIVKYRIMNDKGRAELISTADKINDNGEE